MDINVFFKYYGIRPNSRPFDNSDDAKQDTVFDEIKGTSYHPEWLKFFGQESTPSTSVIFGRKGSGKTALRIQMRRKIEEYNRSDGAKERGKIFVVEYVDFNPFLSAFQQRTKNKKNIFAQWTIADHIDAILSLAVTQYVSEILDDPENNLKKLHPSQKRDLLQFALMYDVPPLKNQLDRWNNLAKKLKYFPWWNKLKNIGHFLTLGISYLRKWWCRSSAVKKIRNAIWVIVDDANRTAALVSVNKFNGNDFNALLIPMQDKERETRTDNSTNDESDVVNHRFRILQSFKEIIKNSGYSGILVIVDQIDEPTLIEGSDSKMWNFIRSICCNKLLQESRLGFKLLLPGELCSQFRKETPEFKTRFRPDKQNLVESLDWSGKSLIDLVNRRLKACSERNDAVRLTNMFDETIRDKLEIEFGKLKYPRNVFQFLHQVLQQHLDGFSSDDCVHLITDTTFQVASCNYTHIQEMMKE
ncbi:hypothetical protein FACS189454_09140 [Planctomycetales bacterium]|nr:hypothetical protein FACS189454_09140 [Planctomycetales bacterium]